MCISSNKRGWNLLISLSKLLQSKQPLIILLLVDHFQGDFYLLHIRKDWGCLTASNGRFIEISVFPYVTIWQTHMHTHTKVWLEYCLAPRAETYMTLILHGKKTSIHSTHSWIMFEGYKTMDFQLPRIKVQSSKFMSHDSGHMSMTPLSTDQWQLH